MGSVFGGARDLQNDNRYLFLGLLVPCLMMVIRMAGEPNKVL